MPTYHYKARDKFGKAVSGLMAGDSEDAVAGKLNQMGYMPVEIKKASAQAGIFNFLDRFKGITPSDLNMFTRQLFVLQKAGLPVLTSLNALKEQIPNKGLKGIVGEVVRDIESGVNLSSALEKHPKVFNALYVNMVAAAESGGELDKTLERLAAMGEYDEKVRLKIQTATRYPMIVLAAISIAFLVLTSFVIPRFARLYGQFAVDLPLPTRILLKINILLTKQWWLLCLAGVLLVFGLRKLVKTAQGRLWWDNLKLKLPVFGPLTLKLTMSRFARTTGTLMHSGVPILKILEFASGASGNVIIARALENIKTNVSEGRGMAEPMKVSGLFTPVVVQMVSVGEDTGRLDDLLLYVSEYYDFQTDYTINNLTSLIEPFLILILGCAVLFMALGIFLPMWNLMNLFRQ